MTSEPAHGPLLYSELAGWFHLLTAPEDYAEEAEVYRQALAAAAAIPVETVLELGSGGGNNASHMKHHVALTLSDLSPAMLAVSREVNPELEHIESDMRTLRLDRTFDAVFAHDAVSYLLDEASVRQAIETAFVHLNPGGAALFAPDEFAEDWRETHDSGGHNGADGRALRYLEWSHRTGGIESPRYNYDLVYALRSPDGGIETVHDRHICAAHPRAFWIGALEDAGFEDVVVHQLTYRDGTTDDYYHIVARKPL